MFSSPQVGRDTHLTEFIDVHYAEGPGVSSMIILSLVGREKRSELSSLHHKFCCPRQDPGPTQIGAETFVDCLLVLGDRVHQFRWISACHQKVEFDHEVVSEIYNHGTSGRGRRSLIP